MSENQQAARALEWLRSLPEECVIAWDSHHVRIGGYATGGWADIECPMLAAVAQWNWCWTVEDPRYLGLHQADDESDEYSELDDFSFVLDFDAELHMVLAPGMETGTPDKLFRCDSDGTRHDLSFLIDEEWNDYRERSGDDSDWRQQQTWAWQSLQNTKPVTSSFGKQRTYPPFASRISEPTGDTIICPIWTTDDISAGLQHWASEHGCQVRFQFNPTIPIPQYLQDVFDAAEQMRENDENNDQY